MDSDNEDSNLVIDEDALEDVAESPESSNSGVGSYSGNEESTYSESSHKEKKKADSALKKKSSESALIKKYSDEAVSENESFPPKKRRKCFNCSKCNKKFPILEGFNSYKKVHEGGKFECSECKSNAISPNNVPQNMQIYTNNKNINSSKKIKPALNSTKSIDVSESLKRKKLPPLFRITSKSRSDQIDDVDFTEKGASTLKKHENEFKKLDKSIQKSSNYFKESDSEIHSHNERIHNTINSKRLCESDVHASESEEEGDIEISISGDSGIGSESGECEANERLRFRETSISSRDMKQVRLSSDRPISDMKKSYGIGIKGRKNIEYSDSLERSYKLNKLLKLTNVDIGPSENQANRSFKSAIDERLQPNNISSVKLQKVANNINSTDIEGFKSVKSVSYSKYLESTCITDGSNDPRKQNPDYPIFIVLDNTSKDDGSNISQTQDSKPDTKDFRSIVEEEMPIKNSSLLHKKILGKHLNAKQINHISSQPNVTKTSESQEYKTEDSVILGPSSKYVHSKNIQQTSLCGPNKKEFVMKETIKPDSNSYSKHQFFNESNKEGLIKEEPIDPEERIRMVRIEESKESINDSSTSVFVKSSQSDKVESAKKDDVQYFFMNYTIDGKSTKTKLAHIPNMVQANQGKIISGEKSTNEQPLNLSMQSGSTSSYEDIPSKTLVNVGNPLFNKSNENIILNRGEIHPNNVIYMSNSDFEKQKMYFNEEISSKDSGSPPLYDLNEQAHPIRDIDLPPLSEVNCDKRRKKSMHRKRVPLYAQPEPDDPEERNRWHRARVTEKNRRERNKEAMRVETERDILKSQLQDKDNIINELRFKLTNTEASTAILQARNSELEEKVSSMNAELIKKQERIDGQWLLFQNLVKKQAMSM